MKLIENTGVSSVKQIQVIEVVATVGSGTQKDPVRVVVSYWRENGDLLAVRDPATDKSIQTKPIGCA